MPRSLLITIHLYLSAFFAVAVILVALSGGLYLLGIKGEMRETAVATLDGGQALLETPNNEAVLAVLARAGVADFSFDYVRASGSRLYTRPTSDTHYLLEVSGDQVSITRREPDLQARMMELHKGHGPSVFKTFQTVFALGMLFIILSGVWLGLSAPRLRGKTALASGLGALVFVALVLS